MARFAQPPSVAEYERMTQRLRLEAAEMLAEALDRIEVKRRTGRPPRRTAADMTAEESLMLAHVMLPVVAHRWPDPPHVQRDRRHALSVETDPRRRGAR